MDSKYILNKDGFLGIAVDDTYDIFLKENRMSSLERKRYPQDETIAKIRRITISCDDEKDVTKRSATPALRRANRAKGTRSVYVRH